MYYIFEFSFMVNTPGRVLHVYTVYVNCLFWQMSKFIIPQGQY